MNENRMYNILLGAHISEKASIIGDQSNCVTFKVSKDATRPEIKEAVEKLYGVEVKDVNVINVKGKVKQSFRGIRKQAGWKKAYVTLKQGQDIDFVSMSE